MEKTLVWIMLPALALTPRPALSRSEPSPKTTALQTVLGIPPTMAAVKEGYVPRGQKFLRYVLIEDIHDNPEAQGKIAAILLYAHHHWGSSQGFVEGAFGPLGPPPFPLFTVDRGEWSVNELLRRGLFSGGELAATLATQSLSKEGIPFNVIGMDDPELYRQQLETYEELSEIQNSALHHLEAHARQGGTQNIAYVRRMVELRMTPSDYRHYRFMRRTQIKDAVLARAIQLGEDFYRLTDLRSQHFAWRTRDRVGNAPCLLVMGGFHVAALTHMLRERKESYVVLAPQVTQSSVQGRYQQCLLKSLSALDRFPYSSLYSHAVCFLRFNLERKRHPETTDKS